jgi:hypothetical protein
MGGYGGYGAQAAAPSMGGYGGYGAQAAAPAMGGYGGYGAQGAAPGYGTQQLSYRAKRSLEDDMDAFVSEYKKLLLTLQSDEDFKFTCNAQGLGEERFVLYENGTKSNEKFCQCFDKTFGSNCAKTTQVKCDDHSRRTTAGHYVPRQYFIECTGGKPNVIKCSEGKIYDKDAKQCIKHSLKKQPEQF